MRISDWSSDVCSSDLLVQFFTLLADRRHDARVGVAVGGDPPARYRVDPAMARGVIEARAHSAVDQRDRLAQTVLGDGMPDGGWVSHIFLPFVLSLSTHRSFFPLRKGRTFDQQRENR